MEAEMLLYALGREANVDQLQIENVGIAVDRSGYIPVNALFQTVVPNIYAAGDVIGAPRLRRPVWNRGDWQCATPSARRLIISHFLSDRNLYDSRNFFVRLY